MSIRSSHITSTIQWQTTFDDAAKGHDLQNTLSEWSNYKLPLKLNTIFDTLCPKDQTWQIPKLELNLGTLNYSSLIGELGPKIEKAIREELVQLARYGTNDEKGIMVFLGASSQIELIRDFLLTGFFQWNYEGISSSINQLFSEVLTEAPLELIAMIRVIGKQENVRRRLAWQLHEENIKRVVRGIEPSNCDFIVEFNTQLVEIYGQEAKGKSNATSIGKDIWFWILSYLLVDRGTFFNKKAFVQSTLLQMAQHYNLEYLVLLGWIERAVATIFQNQSRPLELVLIVDQLLKEHTKGIRKQSSVASNLENDEKALQSILLKNNWVQSREDIETVHTLLKRLIEKNPSKLNKVLEGLQLSAASWVLLVSEINRAHLESWMKSFSSFKTTYLETINYILGSTTSLQIKNPEQIIWSLAIQYFSSEKITNRNITTFVHYLISKLAIATQQTQARILSEILASNTTNLGDFSGKLDGQTVLQGLLAQQCKGSDAAFFEQEFSSVLRQLKKKKALQNLDNEEIRLLVGKFLKAIRLYPSAAVRYMLSYSDVEFIQGLIRLSLDEYTSEVLLKQVNQAFYEWMIQFNSIWKEVKRELGQASNVGPDTLMLFNQGACLYLEHPTLKQDELLNQFLRQIHDQLNEDALPVFFQVLGIMDSDGEVKIDATSFTSQAFELDNKLTTDFNLETVKKVLSNAEMNVDIVRRFFHQQEMEKVFPVWQKLLKKEQSSLLELLYKGSSRVYHSFLNFILKHQAIQQEHVLQANNYFKTFWRSLWDAIKQGKSIEELKATLVQSLTVLFLDSDFQFQEGSKKDSSKTDQLPKSELFNKISKRTNFVSVLGEVSHLAPKKNRHYLVVLGLAFRLVGFLETSNKVHKAENKYWEALNVMMNEDVRAEDVILKPLKYTIKRLPKQFLENKAQLQEILKHSNPKVAQFASHLFSVTEPSFKDLSIQTSEEIPAIISKLDENELLEDLLHHLLLHGDKPVWMPDAVGATQDFITDITNYNPMMVLETYKKRITATMQMEKSMVQLPLPALITTMGQTHFQKQNELRQVLDFYQVVKDISFPSSQTISVGTIIHKLVITAWVSENWNLITPQRFVQEVVWELGTKYSIPKKEIQQKFEAVISLVPPAYRNVIELLFESKEAKMIKEKIKVSKEKKQMAENVNEILPQGVAVNNAGLVLLNGYFNMLFQRLELLDASNNFNGEGEKASAVHYLQYLATRQSQTEESYLVLNKFLCGIILTDPIPEAITITEGEKELMDGLLTAAISHWDAIGDSSVDGFRGNWLVRDGLLLEEEEYWTLTVEKKPYDLLIARSPYSFSIIKLAWMKKPLHVHWDF